MKILRRYEETDNEKRGTARTMSLKTRSIYMCKEITEQ
jgi:hypothetical protein